MGTMIIRPVIVISYKKVKKLRNKKTCSSRKKANKATKEMYEWKKNKNRNTKR